MGTVKVTAVSVTRKTVLAILDHIKQSRIARHDISTVRCMYCVFETVFVTAKKEHK
jgi:hypothetical protein